MRPLRRALGALVTTAAAAAACATVWLLSVWLGGDGSAAVLATVIALSLARREFATRAEFARSSALLPVIGLGAAAAGWLDEQTAALESLTAIKRAGADIVVSYWTKDLASWLV